MKEQYFTEFTRRTTSFVLQDVLFKVSMNYLCIRTFQTFPAPCSLPFHQLLCSIMIPSSASRWNMRAATIPTSPKLTGALHWPQCFQPKCHNNFDAPAPKDASEDFLACWLANPWKELPLKVHPWMEVALTRAAAFHVGSQLPARRTFQGTWCSTQRPLTALATQK